MTGPGKHMTPPMYGEVMYAVYTTARVSDTGIVPRADAGKPPRPLRRFAPSAASPVRGAGSHVAMVSTGNVGEGAKSGVLAIGVVWHRQPSEGTGGIEARRSRASVR